MVVRPVPPAVSATGNAFGVNFAVGGTQSLDANFGGNTIVSPSGGNRATGLLVNAGTTTTPASTNSVCFDGFSTT